MFLPFGKHILISLTFTWRSFQGRTPKQTQRVTPIPIKQKKIAKENRNKGHNNTDNTNNNHQKYHNTAKYRRKTGQIHH